MARVFVTRKLPGPALTRLCEAHDVDLWQDTLPPSAEQLAAGAADAEGLLALLSDRIDEPLLARCPRLRAISNYAVGLDNIDLAAATRHRIPVGHTPDVLTDATADLSFALLLAAARRLPEALAAVHEGGWQTWGPASFLGQAVDGTTLGIVGFGRIGRAVARRAQGFSMAVLYAGPDSFGASDPTGSDSAGERAKRCGLRELLQRSDFVSLHCPLTPDTYHLIDHEALAQMKRTAILINTARGPIVDQSALAHALSEGAIAAAALDVTEPEPLPVDDPLLSVPNLIITPHIGSATRAARERMTELAVDNLLAALSGRPMPHQANVIE